jgi:hypothetical protein
LTDPRSNVELEHPRRTRRTHRSCNHAGSTRLRYQLGSNCVNEVTRAADSRTQDGFQVAATGHSYFANKDTNDIRNKSPPTTVDRTDDLRSVGAACSYSDHRTVGAQRDDPQPRDIGDERIDIAVGTRLTHPRRRCAMSSRNDGQTPVRAQRAFKRSAIMRHRVGFVTYVVG